MPGSGVLSCLDGYMNIALEQTEEHVNGIVTNQYGDAFIRGNNGPIVFPCTICFLTIFYAQYSTYQPLNPCNSFPLLALSVQ
jgi:LSM domain